MIFVTIGTSETFDRLIEAVERLPEHEELVLQVGGSSFRPARGTCLEYVPYEELRELMGQARVVVTHAGVGTILTALQLRKRPVVVPRLKRFGEAVDDHQVALARRLDEAGLVTLVEDLGLLRAAVAAPAELNGHTGASGSLVSELRDYLSASLGAR